MRVTLNGCVVSDDDKWLYDWFGVQAFTPGMVRQAIQDNPEGEDLIFEVNSPGGYVEAGHEMYSVLRSAHGRIHTVAEVQSVAASAASVMICGCDHVAIGPASQLMIHLPAVQTSGNVHTHQASIRMLESTRTAILNAYELRCKGKTSRAQLEEMVEQESWFSAQDAVAAGLADSILYLEGETPLEIPDDLTTSLGCGIRALVNSSGMMPSAAALRAEYERRVIAGAAPADGHPVATPEAVPSAPDDSETPAGDAPAVRDDWRAKARLDIEKSRFF